SLAKGGVPRVAEEGQKVLSPCDNADQEQKENDGGQAYSDRTTEQTRSLIQPSDRIPRQPIAVYLKPPIAVEEEERADQKRDYSADHNQNPAEHPVQLDPDRAEQTPSQQRPARRVAEDVNRDSAHPGRAVPQ